MVKHLRYIITMHTHNILRKNILKNRLVKISWKKTLFDHTKAAVSVVSV